MYIPEKKHQNVNSDYFLWVVRYEFIFKLHDFLSLHFLVFSKFSTVRVTFIVRKKGVL